MLMSITIIFHSQIIQVGSHGSRFVSTGSKSGYSELLLLCLVFIRRIYILYGCESVFKRINPVLCLLLLCPDMFGAMWCYIHALSSLHLPVLASYFHSLSGEHRIGQLMYFILLSIVTEAICANCAHERNLLSHTLIQNENFT